MIIRIGSRDSELAKIQSQQVADRLEAHSDVGVDLTTTSSLGDRNDESTIQELGETGVFTGELDRMVMEGHIDTAVHSYKDCPTTMNEDLTFGAVLPRTTPFDAAIGLGQKKIKDLESDTVIGTSSQRRQANLLFLNQNLEVESCRGNVPTRLKKLKNEDSKFDALLLAAAGLQRLELDVDGRLLDKKEMLPAPAQGAIAVTCRRDNQNVLEVLKEIDHKNSRIICSAERAFLHELEGGCQAPIGALASIRGDQLELKGSVCGVDGDQRLYDKISGPRNSPEEIGIRLANQFFNEGAEELIPR